MRRAYDERLGVPLRWWVQGTMLVATLWLALVVAAPAAASPGRAPRSRWPCSSALLRPTAPPGSASTTAAPRRPGPDRGRAPRRRRRPSTPRQTRRVAGVDADARAYLLLRPYLKRAVRVEITDPADPAPYWLVSTRHPDELAAGADRRSHARRAGPLTSPALGTVPPWHRTARKVWTVFSLVAALGAAAVAKKVLDRSWTAADRQEPAGEPGRPRRRHLARPWPGPASAAPPSPWPGCSAQRRAADYYARSTGHLPPELRKDGQDA